MRAKFIKTRDSGGVGSYVDFKTDWATLTFEPHDTEDGGGALSSADHRQSNIPKYSGNGGGQKEFKKPDAVKKEIPTAIVKSNDQESDDEPVESKISTAGAIRKLGGKTKPHEKKLKLI